jgi:hypothetical protein
MLARALLALRQDLEAQRQLGECLRRDPRCAAAYRLLGELALRNDELKSAEIFFRESLRIDPNDSHTEDLLHICISMIRPTAVVEKLPAATAAVGRPSSPPRAVLPGRGRGHSSSAPTERKRRLARGTNSDVTPPARELVENIDEELDHYLVERGLLSTVQLRAARAYQRSARLELGAAAEALGFASRAKVEEAARRFRRRKPTH